MNTEIANKKFVESIESANINLLPMAKFGGRIEVVNNIAEVQQACDYLSRYKLLGFDTETKPSFKKGKSNKPCLLQLSNHEIAFVFRLNKTGLTDDLRHLLANKDITKVGTSLKDDFRELQKLGHFTPNSFIDLQHFVDQFGIKDKSLKKLTAIVLNMHLSKSQQVSNWENEVLTPQQQIYAATDAWVCLEIYNELVKYQANSQN
jgi:ribonuclease D